VSKEYERVGSIVDGNGLEMLWIFLFVINTGWSVSLFPDSFFPVGQPLLSFDWTRLLSRAHSLTLAFFLSLSLSLSF